MERLKIPEDLEFLRNSILHSQDSDAIRVRICMTGCRAYGAEEIRDAFEHEIEKAGLQEKVEIVDTGCHGFCAKAPVLAIDPMGVFYQQLAPDDVPEIVSRTIMKGEIIERLVFQHPETGERIPKAEDIPFYKKQTRIVLRNCGMIDPKSVSEKSVHGQ